MPHRRIRIGAMILAPLLASVLAVAMGTGTQARGGGHFGGGHFGGHFGGGHFGGHGFHFRGRGFPFGGPRFAPAFPGRFGAPRFGGACVCRPPLVVVPP